MAIREAIAAEVRAALGRDGRNAAALAEATGISTSALSRKLKARAPFWTEELLLIADALNADPAAFLAVIPAEVAA
jgi:transcriptional regulator with XRE-family HTH domain